MEVNVLVVKDQLGRIETKTFQSNLLAKLEAKKLYDKVFEESNIDGTFACAIQNDEGEFTIEYNDDSTYKVEIQKNSLSVDDPLNIFCSNEARYRMNDIFHLDEKVIEERCDDVAKVIRKILDYDELFHDNLDSYIREYLEEQKLI